MSTVRVWEAVPSVLKVHPSALQQLGLLIDPQTRKTPTSNRLKGTQSSKRTAKRSGDAASIITAEAMPHMRLLVAKAKTASANTKENQMKVPRRKMFRGCITASIGPN